MKCAKTKHRVLLEDNRDASEHNHDFIEFKCSGTSFFFSSKEEIN